MRFTKKDLEVFEIPGFADRMQVIADEIRPKLAKLGELIQPQLSRLVNHDLHTHVAEHARRSVNPPEETWVAFGPAKEGYKAYTHFAFCVGKEGVQARVMARQETDERVNLADNIKKYYPHLVEMKGKREMIDFARKQNGKYAAIENWEGFLTETVDRLKSVQTSYFDVGINLPLSGDLSSHAIQAFSKLVPFYALGRNGRSTNGTSR